MADVPEQIRALQMRVSKLETWAGPGQADALSAGARALRTDVADIRRVQRQHTGLLGALNQDVAEAKRVQRQHTGLLSALNQDLAEAKRVQEQHTALLSALNQDVAEAKMALAEILRRLPPAAG
jgi:septal ring factor EnvC (AmiA/AmiB activator)